MHYGGYPMLQINLLPWREKLQIARQREFLQRALYLTILLIFLVVGIILVLKVKINAQNSRNNFIKEQIVLTNAQSSDLSAAIKTREEFIKKIHESQELYASQRNFIQFLNDFVVVVPNNIRITKIGFADKTLSIFGESQTYQAVTGLFRSLNNLNYLKSQTIKQISREKSDDITLFFFNITADYKIP